MKRILILMIVLALTMSLSLAEQAESPLMTEACAARVMARQAIMDKYGLTPGTLSYFAEALQRTDAGYQATYYAEEPDFDYVFGRYTVRINNGKAEASWSWEGKTIPYEGNGLASHAWGREQLEECLMINHQIAAMRYYGIASSIAHSAGKSGGYETPVPETDAEEDLLGGFVTLDDEVDGIELADEDQPAVDAALDAIRTAYRLTEAQMAMLKIRQDESRHLENENGERALTVTVASDNSDPLFFGFYLVTVMQTTGEIISIDFIANNIGNG